MLLLKKRMGGESHGVQENQESEKHQGCEGEITKRKHASYLSKQVLRGIEQMLSRSSFFTDLD
jgi:hypothetical protein